MKPAGSSRGRGIFVFNDISAVSYTEVVIVQRYVDRPLLLDGDFQKPETCNFNGHKSLQL